MKLEKQEMRILQEKISDEKNKSFFYENGIAHVITTDGTSILLIANGEIRLSIDGEVYDNNTKKNAIEKYGLTDKKLVDLQKDDRLILDKNNWFEVIETRDGMNHWESTINPKYGTRRTTIKYEYDSAIQMFKDYYISVENKQN